MAYQVRLLFKVEVTIEPVDVALTKYDDRAREPILQVAREVTPTLINAQVEWTSRRSGRQSRSGREDKSSGYLVLLKREMAIKSYTPKHGDKITNIPDEPGVYYVTSATPHAHRNGKPRTMHVFFQDRMPTKKRE